MSRPPGLWARLAVLAALLLLVGCGGPGRIQYDGGRCFDDGRPLSAQEVEAKQTTVARRITARQPWFAVITIGVVLLAAASNAERALQLVRGRHEVGRKSLAERLRDMLERQRDNRVRFGAIVGGSLALVVIAGASYVYLDIDKRANERALATLQFCHLAMRTQEEEGVLDEQRRNLEAIQSTAGDIRTLVGKLPPDEQRKAQLIVDQMNAALTKQGKIVGDYAVRTDQAQKDLTAHTAAMEKGIASVQGDLAGLRSLPANLKDLEGAAHRIDETTTSFDGRFGELRGRIDQLDAKVDALLARPVPICASPAPIAPPKAATSAPAESSAPAHAPAPKPAADAGAKPP
jgi:hypothetical protein